MSEGDTKRTPRRRLALLGGGCIVLGYPPFTFFPPLLIVGFALFLTALGRCSRRRETFLVGLLFGGAIQLGGFPWLVGTVSRFYRIMPGDTGASESGAFWLGLGAFFVWWLGSTLGWGLLALTLRLAPRSPGGRLAGAVLTVLALETWYPRIFPWTLGSGFSGWEAWAQFSWWVGVSGLTVVVVAGGGLLAIAWERRNAPGRGRRWWGGLAGLLAVMTLLGGIRASGDVDLGENPRTLRVGVIQGKISLERRHSRDRRVRDALSLEILRRTRALAAAESPDLVIWSEGILSEILGPRDPGLVDFCRVAGLPMIFGSLGDVGEQISNRAWISLQPGEVPDYYDKRALMPFGEQFPAHGFLRSIGIPLPPAAIFPGESVKVFEFKDVKLGPSICFEGLLPNTADDLRRVGAELHINLTEDLWYGMSGAPHQHLALTRMRAVEAGLPLVRVTNAGITVVTDARGRIQERTALGSEIETVYDVAVPGTLASRPVTQVIFRYLHWGFPAGLVLLLVLRSRARKAAQISDSGPNPGDIGTPFRSEEGDSDN